MYVLKYVSIHRIVYVLNDNKGTDNGKRNIKVINCTKGINRLIFVHVIFVQPYNCV